MNSSTSIDVNTEDWAKKLANSIQKFHNSHTKCGNVVNCENCDRSSPHAENQCWTQDIPVFRCAIWEIFCLYCHLWHSEYCFPLSHRIRHCWKKKYKCNTHIPLKRGTKLRLNFFLSVGLVNGRLPSCEQWKIQAYPWFPMKWINQSCLWKMINQPCLWKLINQSCLWKLSQPIMFMDLYSSLFWN